LKSVGLHQRVVNNTCVGQSGVIVLCHDECQLAGATWKDARRWTSSIVNILSIPYLARTLNVQARTDLTLAQRALN
jgi:hypothetical protein